MATPLTAHFALEELACTQHREFDNTPPPEVVATLRNTAARMEEVRRLLGGRVISVSSGSDVGPYPGGGRGKGPGASCPSFGLASRGS